MENQPQTEVHESRNKTSFAYSDREINAVNLARNNKENYKYFTIKEALSTRTEDTGILIHENDTPVRNADGGIVIELPACAVDQGSPIAPRLKEQLKHLEEFKKTNPTITIYPIKILFPYKLQAWHWNVGEIIVNNKDNKITISGCAYDSYGFVRPLEEGIQKEIQETFNNHNKAKQIKFNFTTKKENITLVQTGVACGLYAAIAMHNLKTKKVENIWDGILNGNSNDNRKSEQELRNIDSDLIEEHNKIDVVNFCIPDANILPTYKAAAIKKNEALQKAIESLSPLNDANKKDLIEHLNAFTTNKAEDRTRLDELFTNLKDNEAKKIIFNDKGELKIATEILALLPISLQQSISSDNKNSTNTENENIFSACIQLIDNSFRSAIYEIAQNSIQKIEDGFLSKANPTLDEQYIKGYYESVISYIKEIKEEDKTLLIGFLKLTLNETIKQVNEEKELKEKSNQQNTQSNNYQISKTLNQIIIKSDNKVHYYQGFEVVICDKISTSVIAQLTNDNKQNQLSLITKTSIPNKIPDIKEDIDYAFCKQNQQNNQPKALTKDEVLTSQDNVNPASHNFGFRFNSEAGKLINTVNSNSSDAEKNKAWKDLLTNHDTVIFKLASDGRNYIRFHLNRDKNGKIEFAFDECLFSKEEALELSRDSTKYNEIKEKSKKAIDKDERFDIHLYCKSGPNEADKDNQILAYRFESNSAQQPRNRITPIGIQNQSLKKSQIN